MRFPVILMRMSHEHSTLLPAREMLMPEEDRRYERAPCAHCGGIGCCYCDRSGCVLVSAPKRICVHCEGIGCIYCGFTGWAGVKGKYD